jgi:glutamyl-Q tRNA(Asp) synthetase
MKKDMTGAKHLQMRCQRNPFSNARSAAGPRMTSPVFRFAPSPNGYLHLGHALSALINFEMARAAGGRLILRIEDIDAARCRPEYEQAIYQDLAWLGIAWEQPVRRQSAHFDDYRAALARLEALRLVYPSFESRGEIARLVAERETHAPWPRDPDGAPLYPGAARSLPDAERQRRMATGAPYALRLDTKKALKRFPAKWTSGSPQKTRQRNKLARPEPLTWQETGAGPAGETGLLAANPQMWGDVVLARKETPTSYHLSVVIDDARQGVTHIVRGQDLFWATGVHRLLQAVLGLPEPVYHHHRLILDASGQKLSKSTRATALRALREAGAGPADIRRMVGL